MDEPILWSAVKSIFSAVGAIAIGVLGYHVYREGTIPGTTSQPQTPSSSDPLASFRADSGISEERFKEAIDQLAARQELRHKELLVSIRELSQTLKDPRSRKPGGSVLIDEPTELEASDPVQSVEQEGAIAHSVEERIDVPTEVHSAVEAGLDATLLLILSSMDTNKRLNKSNQRFKKLEGSALLPHCGYKDQGDFFELGADHEFRVRGREVLDEIKKQRKQERPTTAVKNGVDISVPTEDVGIPSAPWLIPKPPVESGTSDDALRSDIVTESI